MNTLEVLKSARTTIDTPEKWGKGHGGYPPGDGLHCVVSALTMVNCSQIQLDNARAALEEAVGVSSFRLHRWNDAPERTHAEVLAAFDRAITESEAK